MNEYTRKRQQRGQQQVRQLSIAATLMTTLMILVFHDYKVAISTYSTYLKLLISPIRFIVSTQWLLIIAVSVMSASIGYILGRRQIQVQTNRVHIELISTRVWIQFFRRNPHGNF